MNFNDDVFFMLDIDGVLATTKQYYSNPQKWHPVYNCYKFDTVCVKVFNSILNEVKPIKPIIILSSDWGKQYSLDDINEIFKWNNVQCTISGVTPKLWDIDPTKLSSLEECRASEILKYVVEHNVDKFIVIDDLNLSPWFETNFIHTPRANEGIKQSRIKEKIIKLIL